MESSGAIIRPNTVVASTALTSSFVRTTLLVNGLFKVAKPIDGIQITLYKSTSNEYGQPVPPLAPKLTGA